MLPEYFDEHQNREYSMYQVWAMLNAELPELHLSKNMLYNWVVRRGLIEYRSIPKSLGSTQMTYRVDVANYEKLLNLARAWLRERGTIRQGEETPNE